MSERATSHPTTRSTRSERLVILGSVLLVIAILSIVAFLLVRERANAELSASRSAVQHRAIDRSRRPA